MRRRLATTGSFIAAAVVVLSLATGCGQRAQTRPAQTLDPAAERYVRLVLAMEAHDKGYVDAYHGPQAWRADVESHPIALSDIHRVADSLATAVEAQSKRSRDALASVRARHLASQLAALSARCSMLEGAKLPFDEESRSLYGAAAPNYPESIFDAALARLDALLPGKGSLPARYAAFRKHFIIPPDRVAGVCAAALQEARARTRRHIALPDTERFSIEYVTGKPWGAYNWYQGGYRSLIQVNLDLPIYISWPIGIACHEGYPGHHVYNVLREKSLVRERGWVEFTVYPLYAPESFLGEGTANYGVDLAFPGAERLEFEKRVLYPLAGLDSSQAERYTEVRLLSLGLRYAGIVAARNYLDGHWSAERTQEWLQSHALLTKDEAKQSLSFYDQYRSYTINYALGEDVVKTLMSSRAAAGDDPWTTFAGLLCDPVAGQPEEAAHAMK